MGCLNEVRNLNDLHYYLVRRHELASDGGAAAVDVVAAVGGGDVDADVENCTTLLDGIVRVDVRTDEVYCDRHDERDVNSDDECSTEVSERCDCCFDELQADNVVAVAKDYYCGFLSCLHSNASSTDDSYEHCHRPPSGAVVVAAVAAADPVFQVLNPFAVDVSMGACDLHYFP